MRTNCTLHKENKKTKKKDNRPNTNGTVKYKVNLPSGN